MGRVLVDASSGFWDGGTPGWLGVPGAVSVIDIVHRRERELELEAKHASDKLGSLGTAEEASVAQGEPPVAPALAAKVDSEVVAVAQNDVSPVHPGENAGRVLVGSASSA